MLDDVHAFVAVARCGGFAAAGRQLRVPRSTLSRQIQRLEPVLGVQLMERTTRAVRLTEAGRNYFQRCSPALDSIEAANSSAREAGRQPKGRLRVTAPIDIARFLIGGLLSAFHRRYPEIELSFEVTQRKVDLVAEGYDLALRGGASLDDSSLVARKLCAHVFQLYASPDYLAARGVPTSPSDLAQHELIAFAPGGQAVPWRLVGPDEPFELATTAWLSANETGLLISAMAAGLGIGLGEAISVERELREGRLQPVLPEYSMHGGTLYAVYPSARRVPAKVRVFIEALHAELNGAPRSAR